MTEGRVYITTWKQTDTGYRVWVKGRPKLAAEGPTFEEADRRLTEVIGLATGDGENVHEYVPPAPAQEAAVAGERARAWVLGIQSSAEMADPSGLFEGGLCTNCLMPRGTRTAAPLAIGRIESQVQASTVSLPKTSPGVGPILSVYSSELLGLLTPDERSQFEWRPVVVAKRDGRDFFELVRSTVLAPFVGLKG